MWLCNHIDWRIITGCPCTICDLLFCTNFFKRRVETLEPCTDVIVWAAARRSILVGGDGAPLVQKIGGGQKICFKGSRKNFVLVSKFSDDLLFSHRSKIATKQVHRKMASAAGRQIIGGGGAPINKSRRRRRQQIVRGGGL